MLAATLDLLLPSSEMVTGMPRMRDGFCDDEMAFGAETGGRGC